MTDSKIDITRFSELNLEAFSKNQRLLGEESLRRLTVSTKLTFDPANQQIDQVDRDRIFPTIAIMVNAVREADSNGDGTITRDEFKDYFKLEGEALDQAFNGLEDEIQKVFVPLLKGIRKLDRQNHLLPLFEALETYNDGILIEEIRRASSVLTIHHPLKPLGNAAAFLNILPPQNTLASPMTAFPFDERAKTEAKHQHQQRAKAVSEFRDVVESGIEKNEPWTKPLDLKIALLKLSKQTRDILEQELPIAKLHEILGISDPETRDRAIFDFCQEERPLNFGFAGGRILKGGRFHNMYFARSATAYLQRYTEPIQADLARKLRFDMIGDGGGFINTFAHLLSSAVCSVSASCDPVPLRTWSDEAKLNALGRFFNGALSLLVKAVEPDILPFSIGSIDANMRDIHNPFLSNKNLYLAPFPELSSKSTSQRKIQISD